jgi:hypothetical protein
MAERPALVQTPPSFRLNVPGRLGLLGTLLFAEKIALSFLIDARRARDAEGLGAFLHAAQHWGFRYLVTFLTAVSVLARKRPLDAGARAYPGRAGSVKLLSL